MLESAFSFLWFLCVATLAVCGVLIWRRKLVSEFPVFFSYLAVQALSNLTMMFLRQNYAAYFYFYWTSCALMTVLEIAVMYEIFTHVFRPYDALRKMASLVFRWVIAVLVLVALVTSVSGAQSEVKRVLAVVLALDRSMRVMQVGLVLFLMLFAQQVGLTQRHRVFGIALGFGVTASVELTLVTLRAAYGAVGHTEMNFIKSMVFLAATVLWGYYMAVPEPERMRVEVAAEARRWDWALSDANGTVQQGPFLPMIEDAVERILRERDKRPS